MNNQIYQKTVNITMLDKVNPQRPLTNYTKRSKGDYGEAIAKKILEKMGFTIDYKLLDEDGRTPSYDLLAKRLGQKYAINVKYGDTFHIGKRNLERLDLINSNTEYKPAYLFVFSENHYWFYSLDREIPSSVDTFNHKMENFISEDND